MLRARGVRSRRRSPISSRDPTGKPSPHCAALRAAMRRETGCVLWGAPGAGKSHLLRAAAAAVRRGAPRVATVPRPGELPGRATWRRNRWCRRRRRSRRCRGAGAAVHARTTRCAARGGALVAAAAHAAGAPAAARRPAHAAGLGPDVYEVRPLADADKPAALRPPTRSQRGFASGRRRDRLPACARPARHAEPRSDAGRARPPLAGVETPDHRAAAARVAAARVGTVCLRTPARLPSGRCRTNVAKRRQQDLRPGYGNSLIAQLKCRVVKDMDLAGDVSTGPMSGPLMASTRWVGVTLKPPRNIQA